MSNKGKGLVVVSSEIARGAELVRKLLPGARHIRVRGGACERSKLEAVSSAKVVVLCTDSISHKVHFAIKKLVSAGADMVLVSHLNAGSLAPIEDRFEEQEDVS